MAGLGHKLIVHFMRHAAALHKMNDETDVSIRDPGLSPKGEQQCKDFSDAFKGQENHIDCILASPMTRVLQTACSAFKEVIKPTKGGDGHTVIAMPQLQNLDSGINGTGLDPNELADRYNGVDWDKDRSGLPRGWVDTSFVQEGWNVKKPGKWSAEEVQWRLEYIQIFLQAIWVISGTGRCKTEVVIVTHGSLLRKLVNDVRFADAKLTHCVFSNDDGGFKEISKEELDILRNLKSEDIETELDDEAMREIESPA